MATLAVQAAVGTGVARAGGVLAVGATEEQELAKINAYRAEQGLPKLVIDHKLTNAARWMANDLATHNYFDHTDRFGRDPFQRMTRFKYPDDTYRGENLAAGNEDPEPTFVQWRESLPHRANMVGRNYRAIGIARAYDASSEYGWYWVTEFGSRVTRRMATPSILKKYPPKVRRRIRKRVRACRSIRRGNKRWRSKRCTWHMRAARELGMIAESS